MKTRRERMKKSFSLVIAGAIVLLTALFMWASQVRGEAGLRPGQGIVAGMVLALAAISVAVVYWQAKERNKRFADLQPEYREIFDQVTEWVGQSSLYNWEKREVEQELLAMFLQAQQAGRGVKTVIGQDVESFAKEILDAYGIHSGLVAYLLTSTQWYLLYLVIVQGYRSLSRQGGSYFAASMDVEILFLFAWISYVTLPLIQYGAKGWVLGKRNRGLYAIFGFLSFLIGVGIIEGLHAMEASWPWAAGLLAKQVIVFEQFWHLGLGIGLLLCIVWLKRWLRRKSLR